MPLIELSGDAYKLAEDAMYDAHKKVLPDPLTPGEAIVAALFPTLDADVKAALGELVARPLQDPAFYVGLDHLGITIERWESGDPLALGDRAIVATFNPALGFATAFTASERAQAMRNGAYHYASGTALLPAIKAATARMKHG